MMAQACCHWSRATHTTKVLPHRTQHLRRGQGAWGNPGFPICGITGVTHVSRQQQLEEGQGGGKAPPRYALCCLYSMTFHRIGAIKRRKVEHELSTHFLQTDVGAANAWAGTAPQ